jgi:hypothetical protein
MGAVAAAATAVAVAVALILVLHGRLQKSRGLPDIHH